MRGRRRGEGIKGDGEGIEGGRGELREGGRGGY